MIKRSVLGLCLFTSIASAQSISGGGGIATIPGGTPGQLQYNNSGAFGGLPAGTGVTTALGNAVNGSGSLILDTGGTLTSPTINGVIPVGGGAAFRTATDMYYDSGYPGGTGGLHFRAGSGLTEYLTVDSTGLKITQLSGLVKANGAAIASVAVAGTDYVSPAGLASPPAIGATTPSTGKFTTLQATTSLSVTALLASSTAPVATTFCTAPSIPNNNGTAAFTINVGTACASSAGTITLPAATNGWVCDFHDVTTPASNIVEQTGGTTTTVTLTNYARTTGVAANFTSSDIIRAKCMAY